MGRGKEFESGERGMYLDAAAHSTAFVLDYIGAQRFRNAETFDLHVLRQNKARTGDLGRSDSDPSLDLAISHMHDLYLNRLSYLEVHMKQPKFKAGYRLPWAVLAKALIYERAERYRELASSPYAAHREAATRIPLIVQYLGALPEEQALQADIDRVILESKELLEKGDLRGVIDAISDCLNVGPLQIPPTVAKKGNLFRVDFTTAVAQSKSTLVTHNEGLVGAYADMYLLDEFLREKAQFPG